MRGVNAQQVEPMRWWHPQNTTFSANGGPDDLDTLFIIIMNSGKGAAQDVIHIVPDYDLIDSTIPVIDPEDWKDFWG